MSSGITLRWFLEGFPCDSRLVRDSYGGVRRLLFSGVRVRWQKSLVEQPQTDRFEAKSILPRADFLAELS